jgi:hypothetical protein
MDRMLQQQLQDPPQQQIHGAILATGTNHYKGKQHLSILETQMFLQGLQATP